MGYKSCSVGYLKYKTSGAFPFVQVQVCWTDRWWKVDDDHDDDDEEDDDHGRWVMDDG